MPDPINLPDIVGWTECTFDPVRPRNVDRMEGRRVETQSFGQSYWKASFSAPWLEEEDFGKMDAFMMQAGDDGETFLAYDPFRPRPIAHDNGQPLSGVKAVGGAFNGEGSLTTIVNPRSIIVSGLPAAFSLSPGDYLEVRKNAATRSLHRIMASAQASSGGAVTLSIKYGLDTQNFSVGDIVNFEKASCTMQIDPDSYSGSKSWDSRAPSFTATEVFF